jgi:chromosome segregation ATPase
MQRARQFLIGLAIVAALGLAVAAPAQQPPAPKPASEQEKPKPPAKKAKRVWTGEDLKDLRTPADEHEEKKAAAAEAEAKEAAEKEKKAGEKTGAPAEEQKPEEVAFNAPTTVEEAEQRIAEKSEEIQFQTEKIRETRGQLFNERDDRLRADLEKQIQRLNADLEEAQAELALLEKTLKDLKAKVPAAPPAKSPGQP